jgi:hypothetical protein
VIQSDQLGIQIIKDERDGNLKTQAILTDEQLEILKTLSESQGWKLYRQLLIQMKEGYFHQTLSMSETNDIVKTIGHVAGINLAVNQLVVLMDLYKHRVKQREAKAVERVTKNAPSKPDVKG